MLPLIFFFIGLINCYRVKLDCFTDSGGSDESAQVYRYFYFGTPEVNYSCVQDLDSLGGTGNINSELCFVGRNSGDYHLQWSSDCINAGATCFCV